MGKSWILVAIVFTLSQQSYILIVFVLSCPFWKKGRKTRHTGKIFTSALCSRHILWALSRALARLSGLSFVFRVLRNSLHAAIQDNIYPRCVQTALHNGLKTSGPPLDFSTVPFRRWRGITFAMVCSANFSAYNGNVQITPAPLKDTTWTLLIFGSSERNVRPLVRCSLKASD